MPDCLYLVTFTHLLSGAEVSVKLLAGSETIATWAARLLLNPGESWRFQSVAQETESTATPGATNEPPLGTGRTGGAPRECTSGRAGSPETCVPGAHRPPCPSARPAQMSQRRTDR